MQIDRPVLDSATYLSLLQCPLLLLSDSPQNRLAPVEIQGSLVLGQCRRVPTGNQPVPGLRRSAVPPPSYCGKPFGLQLFSSFTQKSTWPLRKKRFRNERRGNNLIQFSSCIPAQHLWCEYEYLASIGAENGHPSRVCPGA